MIRVGLIGWGYWGPTLARALAETPGVEVAAVADSDPERLEAAWRRFPQATYHRTGDDLINVGVLDAIVLDAIVLATPVSTHYELARRALEGGLHVLVSKPLAASVY